MIVKTKRTLCDCGCGKYYQKWLNPPKISDFRIEEMEYAPNPQKVLSIIRVTDGVEFRLGDTVKLKSATGKTRLAKLYHIRVKDKFLQLSAYPLKTNGTYVIRNEQIWLNSADDFTNFLLLENVTK